MPDLVRERLEPAVEAELLGRISLMTAAGFSSVDIAQRVRMDMGLEIEEGFVHILQVELGLVRNNARVEVQRRLLAEGLAPDEASRMAAMIWDFPAKAGIRMAEKGISCRQVLRELPRPTAQAVRAGYDLCKILRDGRPATYLEIQRLMARAKVVEKELSKLIPEGAERARGLSMGVKLPRGFRLTKDAS